MQTLNSTQAALLPIASLCLQGALLSKDAVQAITVQSILSPYAGARYAHTHKEEGKLAALLVINANIPF